MSGSALVNGHPYDRSRRPLNEIGAVEAAKTTEVAVAPAAGVVRELLQQAGEVVPIGEPLAVIESSG